jgi:hypothetical protein
LPLIEAGSIEYMFLLFLRFFYTDRFGAGNGKDGNNNQYKLQVEFITTF